MIELLAWGAVILAAVAGLVALGRRKPLTEKEYRSQRGKGAGVGNALLAFQEILEPQRGQVAKSREERREAGEPGGDPPEPGEPDTADKPGP